MAGRLASWLAARLTAHRVLPTIALQQPDRVQRQHHVHRHAVVGLWRWLLLVLFGVWRFCGRLPPPRRDVQLRDVVVDAASHEGQIVKERQRRSRRPAAQFELQLQASSIAQFEDQ
jgi:hypothetical protein